MGLAFCDVSAFSLKRVWVATNDRGNLTIRLNPAFTRPAAKAPKPLKAGPNCGSAPDIDETLYQAGDDFVGDGEVVVLAVAEEGLPAAMAKRQRTHTHHVELERLIVLSLQVAEGPAVYYMS